MNPPKPYYERNGISIYHGDCREILPSLPVCDLLVTDPPYGVSFQSGFRAQPFDVLTGDDGSLDVPAALRLALSRLHNSRHCYIFGRFDLSTLPLSVTEELIWDKGLLGPGDLSLPWGRQHEVITFGVHKASAAHREQRQGALAARLRRGSVLRHMRTSTGSKTAHPTEKPVPLLRELIESSSCFGETVLDPFAGSGSALVAALLEGRRAIGIEVEERYCEVAARRLEQAVLPLEVVA